MGAAPAEKPGEGRRPSRQHQETSPRFSGPQLRRVTPTPVDGLLLARREKRDVEKLERSFTAAGGAAAVCVQVDCVPTGERLVLEDRRRKWPLRAARPQSALRPGCQTQARTAARAPWTRSPDDLTTGRPCSVQRRRCPQADPVGAPAPEALTGLALGPPLLRAAAPQSGLEVRVSRLSLLPTLNVRQSILERKSKDRRARGAKHVPVPI